MTMPYYVAPEQAMKDKADFARKGIARGRSAVVLTFADGVLLCAENPSTTLRKLAEIYDRIAFAGVGKFNEFDQLRIAGIRHADLKGYSFSREDVDARSLANQYAQILGQIFTHEMKPMEVEIVVAEIGDEPARDQLFHIRYDGTVIDETTFIVIGGDSETIAERLTATYQPLSSLDEALCTAVRALGGPDRTLTPPNSKSPTCPAATAGAPSVASTTIELASFLGRSRPARLRRRPGRPHRPKGVAPHPPDDGYRGAQWTGESSASRTSTGSPALCAVNDVSAPTRWPATSSAGWCRGAVAPTSSWPTAPGSISTSGSHPEYATPECDSIYDLVAHDKAGERILENLLSAAEQRLREEGIRGDIFLFKNNTDSAGNSYGCHENYLTSRRDDLSSYAEVLIPFLVSRQIYAGAGKVLQTARGAMYCIAQRAEHIWEGVSSATTRSRPIINTRDEPHADAERYRRLHVIVGDSNMSEYSTFLKVGACSLLLRMLEDPKVVLRDMTLENPIRAIREISHDLTCRRRVRLANGREASALEIQSEYLNRAMRYADHHELSTLEKQALTMWEHCLAQIEKDPLSLDREVRLGHQVQADRGLPRASRPGAGRSSGRVGRSAVPRRQSLARPLLPHAKARSGRTHRHRRRHRPRGRVPARDDPGAVAGRVHPAGQRAQARLHGRLGASQAQRPSATHGALQGPVQGSR